MSSDGKWRIFITGGSGYIGSRIVEFAVAQGYTVHGLSRSEKNDGVYRQLGAVPVRGDLTSVDLIGRESAAATAGVMHLATAFTLDPAQDQAEATRVENAAVDAMADALRGSGRPLVLTSGTLYAVPDPAGEETDEEAPMIKESLNERPKSLLRAMVLRETGVNVYAVRLAPYVYGRGGSGVRLFMGIMAGLGEGLCVGDGATRTSVVHVDDAARMYLAVAEQRPSAYNDFNATSSTEVTSRQLVEAMAATLGIPVRSATREEVGARAGPIAVAFQTMQNRASSARARKVLGWEPREVGVLEDIRTGSYVQVAKELMKSAGGAS